MVVSYVKLKGVRSGLLTKMLLTRSRKVPFEAVGSSRILSYTPYFNE